jgi:hypothetical protein
MIRVCLITLLFHISLATALAETFDYQGSAIVDCVCPAPFGSSDCGVPQYQEWRYSFRIAVSPGLTGDLGDACFRRRDRVVCCERPRSWYRGVVGKHCPWRPDCN